jgi:porin
MKPKYLIFLFLSFFISSFLWGDNKERKTASNTKQTSKTEKKTENPYKKNLINDPRGRRTKLKEKGIEFTGTLYLDGAWNLKGGIQTTRGADILTLLNLALTFHSEPLAHYKGGTFFAQYSGHHGQNPSEKDVGSFNPVDNIESPSFDSLYSIWYRQTWGKNWVLLGKSDAYTDCKFIYLPHAVLLLNDGYFTPPTVLLFPSYPNSAMSLVGYMEFSKSLSLELGVFDGNLLLFNNTAHFTSRLFYIGELTLRWWPFCCEGKLGLGVWHVKINDHISPRTTGPYIIFDQTLYHKNQQDLGIFLMYAFANPRVSSAQHYVGTGFAWKGLLKKRPDDTFGLGMSKVFFSDQFVKPCETSYEAFYDYFFCPWGSIEPDLQYVSNPGGQGLPNALVFILRLFINF